MSTRTSGWDEECWIRVYPESGHGILSCHFTELLRKRVVPKYPGQIFHFVDLGECWMYTGDAEPEPEPKDKKTINWSAVVVIVIFVLLCALDLALAWYLFSRLEWL